MYSGKKGKSGSKRPADRKVSSWMTYKPKEIELLIVKLAKSGLTQSQIGLHLRDLYGIPDIKAIMKKSLTEILKAKDLLPEIPEDLMAILKKEVFLRKHLEKNHKDEGAKRGLILAQSKAKRLAKFYKRTGKLHDDWKYDPKRVALLIE